MRITTIIKILSTPEEVARLCLNLFGEGTANPEAPIIEEFIAVCMTPPLKGYTRVLINSDYLEPLQYLMDEYVSTDVEVISIEPDGQKMFQTGVDLQGNPEYLSMHNAIPMYHEPVLEVI